MHWKLPAFSPISFNLKVTWEHGDTKAPQVERERPVSPVCKQLLCRMSGLRQLVDGKILEGWGLYHTMCLTSISQIHFLHSAKTP